MVKKGLEVIKRKRGEMKSNNPHLCSPFIACKIPSHMVSGNLYKVFEEGKITLFMNLLRVGQLVSWLFISITSLDLHENGRFLFSLFCR